jgi:hypothetical protein
LSRERILPTSNLTGVVIRTFVAYNLIQPWARSRRGEENEGN